MTRAFTPCGDFYATGQYPFVCDDCGMGDLCMCDEDEAEARCLGCDEPLGDSLYCVGCETSLTDFIVTVDGMGMASISERRAE
jgi:hypothetical protein